MKIGDKFYRKNGDVAKIVRIREYMGKNWITLRVLWYGTKEPIYPEYSEDTVLTDGEWIINERD